MHCLGIMSTFIPNKEIQNEIIYYLGIIRMRTFICDTYVYVLYM